MSSSTSLDDFIDRIVREVIRRLREAEISPLTPALSPAEPVERGQVLEKGVRTLCLPERLITAASIETLPPGTTEITIPPRAILTPLARDEARDRGIRIVRQSQGVAT